MHAKMTTVAPPPTPATEFTAESHQEPHRTTEASRQVSSRSPTTPLPPQTTLQHLTVPFDAADPLAPVQDSSTSPLESQIHPDPPLSSASSAHASTASPDRVTSAKADYGWLTDLMARWIEDLNKRYPATLRAEGVEGKVLLTAILRDDGLLSDVRVVKGSGNATLDEVALEDVRNGPLIPLSRPLERAQMPVKFSIIYDLKTVR
jgi:TonB family protein